MGVPRTDYYDENTHIIALERQVAALKKRLQRSEEARRSTEKTLDYYQMVYRRTIEKLKSERRLLNNKNNKLQETYEALLKENKVLTHLSHTDQLTGLLNRRRIEEILQKEYKRMRRYCTPLSLILLDIDHFKRVNDKYGHLIGDKVLVKMAHLLKQNVRLHDAVARWGGEEFMILLPFTSGEKALQVAEKLRYLVTQSNFPQIGNMSSSFGIAEFQPYENASSAIHHADEALYQAKHTRNSCVLYSI